MSVRRLSNSFISTEGRGKSSTLLAGYSPAIDEMDLIERITVGSGGTSAIVFDEIPQTYQHLQIRGLFKSTQAISSSGAGLRFNSDSGSNYARHDIGGNGSTVTAAASSSTIFSPIDGRTDTANAFGAVVVDILDYANTSKNKVTRSLFGLDNNGSGAVVLLSSLWMDTSAISSITIYGNNFSGLEQHTTFSLYGVKA